MVVLFIAGEREMIHVGRRIDEPANGQLRVGARAFVGTSPSNTERARGDDDVLVGGNEWAGIA